MRDTVRIRLRAWMAMLIVASMAGCEPNRDTRSIKVVAKPPLIEHQFCLALHDAEREPQDSMVVRGTAIHGSPDVFQVTCDGREYELGFELPPAVDDNFGMKELRKQWNKKTGVKDARCPRCPKYDVTAKFVGMVRKSESGKLVFVAQTADEIRLRRNRAIEERISRY